MNDNLHCPICADLLRDCTCCDVCRAAYGDCTCDDADFCARCLALESDCQCYAGAVN
jgi:hypothetical protein